MGRSSSLKAGYSFVEQGAVSFLEASEGRAEQRKAQHSTAEQGKQQQIGGHVERLYKKIVRGVLSVDVGTWQDRRLSTG